MLYSTHLLASIDILRCDTIRYDTISSHPNSYYCPYSYPYKHKISLLLPFSKSFLLVNLNDSFPSPPLKVKHPPNLRARHPSVLSRLAKISSSWQLLVGKNVFRIAQGMYVLAISESSYLYHSLFSLPPNVSTIISVAPLFLKLSTPSVLCHLLIFESNQAYILDAYPSSTIFVRLNFSCLLFYHVLLLSIFFLLTTFLPSIPLFSLLRFSLLRSFVCSFPPSHVPSFHSFLLCLHLHSFFFSFFFHSLFLLYFLPSLLPSLFPTSSLLC